MVQAASSHVLMPGKERDYRVQVVDNWCPGLHVLGCISVVLHFS